MAHGTWEGKDAHHPEVRSLFDRDAMLSSDWYAARLEAKASADRRLWEKHVADLSAFLGRSSRLQAGELADVDQQLQRAQQQLAELQSGNATELYHGTLGLEPAFA